jgi:hypothetical protein
LVEWALVMRLSALEKAWAMLLWASAMEVDAPQGQVQHR